MEKRNKSSKGKKILLILAIIFMILAIIGALAFGVLFGMGPFGFIRDNSIKNHAGNSAAYELSSVEVLENSPLEGMHIAFLGSSVTEGDASLGVTFVEYMAARNSFTYVKEAVGGTTLVDRDDVSYIQRMVNNISLDEELDLFVCQLSTNDATRKLELGSISTGTDIGGFDTNTITGAIEYIIAYVDETWGCPVVFYTGTKYDNEHYEAMVDTLLQLQEKWGIGVIDLWNAEEMNAVSETNYKLYMMDNIHPTRAGYLEWWTPFMEECLYTITAK